MSPLEIGLLVLLVLIVVPIQAVLARGGGTGLALSVVLWLGALMAARQLLGL